MKLKGVRVYDNKIKNSETYGIVPDFVLYDNDLTLIELKTYIQVNKLSNKKGYCYASNDKLAEYLSCTKNSIINAIKKLVDKGYLEKRLNYWEGTEGVKNKILIPIKPTGSQVEVTTSNKINYENTLPSQVDDTTLVNSSLPPSQVEVTRPSQVDDTHNNISKQYNTNNINEQDNPYPETGHETDDAQFINNFDAICEEIKKAWNNLHSRVPKIKTVTASNKKDIKTILESNSIDDILSAIMEIDNSDFLGGYKADFKANFNWFLKYDNFSKILDGGYKDINNPWNTDKMINNNYYFEKDEVDENFNESLKEWENGANR